MKLGVQALRAIVRGFHAEGATIRRQISSSKGERKYALWERKRAVGRYARNHMIAYGLLRGLRYEDLEKPAAVNPPNISDVHDIMKRYGGWSFKLTLDDLRAILLPSEQRA